jgi:hypothetical protein
MFISDSFRDSGEEIFCKVSSVNSMFIRASFVIGVTVYFLGSFITLQCLNISLFYSHSNNVVSAVLAKLRSFILQPWLADRL